MTDVKRTLSSRATAAFAFLLLAYLVSSTSGEYDDKSASGMWFGPRLGKRHREENLDMDSEPEGIDNALHGARWALVIMPGSNKRQVTQFTPRLGRESGEDLMFHENIKEQDDTEPMVFTPRLGRRTSSNTALPTFSRMILRSMFKKS